MQASSYAIAGFDVAGIAAGIKKSGALDLALITSRSPCSVAATFTQNRFPAAPVLYDRQLLHSNPDQVYGVVINSGNANACTGVEGNANARRMAEAVEQQLGAGDQTIWVMSTGVIGVQLPIDKIQAGVQIAAANLHEDGWEDAARAIMTTDTVPKLATHTLHMGESTVRFSGMSKGAGMIHPDMATMLSVIATNVDIAQPLLQQALSYAVTRSYNRISIDGDTSTNDTVMILANGLAANPRITDAQSDDYRAFQNALTAICIDLAQAVVRDGEGATKFITIQVNGGLSDEDAHRAANTIAISPLCKTAFYGGDANWGRFVMALGRSGAYVVPETCSIYICGGERGGARMVEVQLLDNGAPTGYAEADAAARFAQAEIDVRVELHQGTGSATVWTCDLSHEYVTINADYRT